MKIIFMGTPDFAIPSLEKLYNSRHTISAVVTAPDKERGRGQKVSFTPVKEFALKNNLPILQPEKLKDQSFISTLKTFDADIFVVVAFKILPPEVFTIPAKVSFNLHASLLPKYRGAAPIQWALIKGEKETGVTTFALEEKVDTGNIFLQKKTNINDEDNFGSLHDKLSLTGAEAVLETVDLIDSGSYSLQPQNNEEATPAPKISKETGLINWNDTAGNIHNLVRGLSPYPGAYFYYAGAQIKIYRTEISELKLKPGEIKQTKTELFIGCLDNSLKIIEIQKEGRKKMSAEDFMRGFNFTSM